MKKILSLIGILVLFLALVVMPAGPAQAQSGNFWHVEYFPNPDWSGSPVLMQDVSWVYYDWGYGAPGANMPADNFTARMTTDAFFYGSTYGFSILADDEAVLTIDGTTWLDTRGKGLSGKSLLVTVPMWQGVHRIEILYREYTEQAYFYANWTYLGGPMPVPPPATGVTPSPYPPLPLSATSVATQFGDFTPCISQNIHQSNCFVSDGQWDSPNLGSIEMEPKITVWGQCVADNVATFTVPPTNEAKQYKCSKTKAGLFPQ